MFTKVFRIGNDAEIRFTPKGDAVLNLSLAYNYGRKGEDGKRPTQWIDGSLWGKQAEALQPYLLKGSQIGATIDDLHIEKYDGKNGDVYKLVGRIINIELVSSKPAEPPQDKPRKPMSSGENGFEGMEDSIPF